MALGVRLESGDVTALREVVLRTRPKVDSLTWNFSLLGDWIIRSGDVAFNPEGAAELFAQANFLFTRKRYDDAIIAFNKMEKVAPQFLADALRGKAAVRKFQGAASWGKRTSLEPDTPSGDYFMRESLSLLEECIRIEPADSECHYELGSTLFTLGRTLEAIEQFEEAIRINHMSYLSHYGLGLAFYRLERDEDSVFHLLEFLKHDPSSQYSVTARELLAKMEDS